MPNDYNAEAGERSFHIDGIEITPPVKYEGVSAVLLFFWANRKKAEELMNSDYFKPVKVFGNISLCALTIFDYKNCPVGPYREIAFSIVSYRKGKVFFPVAELFFRKQSKNMGYYALQLAMNTDLGRKHSEAVFGYPTFPTTVSVDISIKENIYSCGATETDEILSLSLNLTAFRKYKKRNEQNATFFRSSETHEEKMVVMDVQGDVAEGFCASNCHFSFRNHSLVKRMITPLLLSNQPFYCLHYKNATEILQSPENI